MEILVIILICSFFFIQSIAFLYFFLWIRKNCILANSHSNEDSARAKEETITNRQSFDIKDTPMFVINVNNSDGRSIPPITTAATAATGQPVLQSQVQPSQPPAAMPVQAAPVPEPAPAPAAPSAPVSPPRPAHPQAPQVITPEPEPEAVTPEPTTKKCKNCGAENSQFREKCFRCNAML